MPQRLAQYGIPVERWSRKKTLALVMGVVRAGGPEWRARRAGFAGVSISSKRGRPGTWFGASRGRSGWGWRARGGLASGPRCEAVAARSVRVPGAYLRHAPVGGGDMKLSGDDRASSLT